MNIIQEISFGLSVLFFITGIGVFIHQMIKHKGRSVINKLFGPTVCLFLSVFSLRFCVGFYEAAKITEPTGLNWFENLLHSLVSALQTFSLDATYIDTITVGKDLFAKYGNEFWVSFYGIFVVVINICAPVLGGAILLGILINSFPHIRVKLNPFRVKYVFSELNQKAVVFAEDIINQAREERKKKITRGIFTRLPLIIFTDAYVDDQDEMSSELQQRAKILGAICIKDDLLQLRFKYTKKIYYMLLDEKSIDNIHALTTLAMDEKVEETEKEKQKIEKKEEERNDKKEEKREKKKNRKRRKTERWNPFGDTFIYLFSQNEEAGSIVKKLYNQNKEKLENVVIKVVQECTSIAYNLFYDTPLYSPLLTKYGKGYSGEKELAITIIGSGKIGTEVFLLSYWCGQMLDCKLTINVISNEADEFMARLNNFNPDILNSGMVNGEKTAEKEILRIYPHKNKNEPDRKEYSDPYAYFNFIEAEVKTGLSEVLDKTVGGRPIFASDYFVVVLGADELNMTVAAEIKRKIQREEYNGVIKNTPVIAYSVYDSYTNAVINRLDMKTDDTYFKAFASLKDIYSYRNIIMDHMDSTKSAQYDDSYEGEMAQMTKKAKKKAKNKKGQDLKEHLKNDYNWWSRMARLLHVNYKIYSTGFIKWDKDNKPIGLDEDEYWKKAIDKFKIGVDDKGNDIYDDNPNYDPKLGIRLIWLEHRRWNAFMRAKGFSTPNDDQWEKFAYKNGEDHKNIDLRLHPCIVECSHKIPLSKLKAKLEKKSEAELEAELNEIWNSPSYKDNVELDYLDRVSIMVYQKNKDLNEKLKKIEPPKKTDYKASNIPQQKDHKIDTTPAPATPKRDYKIADRPRPEDDLRDKKNN
jgi:hypothetical protein